MSDVVSEIQSAPPPESRLPPLPPSLRRPRIWPGVGVVAVMWLVAVGPRWLELEPFLRFLGVFWAPIVGTAGVVVWWLFFSRLRWSDRLLTPAACVTIGVVACAAMAKSDGVQSSMSVIWFYAARMVLTVWVLWLIATPSLRWPLRRAGLLAALVLTWGYFACLRFEGVDGQMNGSVQWRWAPKAEDIYLAEAAAKPAPAAAAAETLTLQPGDWPGFRGPNRDDRRTGVRISTDWTRHPPRQLWRHRVGPGWGSFAVVGNHLYTQEQRGNDEAVVCYNADTGGEIWAHSDPARFTEPVAGPGPRATPTFHDSKVYALGAKGQLNCLDAATGQVVWTRDVVADCGAKVPQWGFAASPLVMNGVVTVFAGGPDGKSVLGYNASSGDPVWHGGDGLLGYSSPHPAKLDGVEQVLMATEKGLTAFEPAHGEVLWRHDWPLLGMFRVVQPTVLDDSDVLLAANTGARRIHVNHSGDGWTTEEVWTSGAFKPFFNDLVLDKDYLYGFDGVNFTCVSLEDGKGRWRTSKYAAGQVLLLADQDLLLVLSEQGDAALVEAKPESYKEVARFKALEGKTWNHPVVAGGKLFVRNGEEAACYELTEMDATGPSK